MYESSNDFGYYVNCMNIICPNCEKNGITSQLKKKPKGKHRCPTCNNLYEPKFELEVQECPNCHDMVIFDWLFCLVRLMDVTLHMSNVIRHIWGYDHNFRT